MILLDEPYAGVDPAHVDFEGCHMVVHKNGQPLSEGYGRAALGSPLICVAWLANTFGERGIALKAGDIVLSGSLVPLEPVAAGVIAWALLGEVPDGFEIAGCAVILAATALRVLGAAAEAPAGGPDTGG